MTPQIRVVGAGLTGLAAAWRLSELGVDVEVVEASAVPGGLLQTTRTSYGLVERSANALLQDEAVERLVRGLDLSMLDASPIAKRRFIFRGGRSRRWPLTPIESATMAWRRLRARIGHGLNPASDETVAQWSDRVWGPDATTWLISPGLQGIYGAPASQLDAAAVFGVDGRRLAARSRRSRLVAPASGMGELPQRLVERLIARGVAFSFDRRLEALDVSVSTLVCTNGPEAGRLIECHAPRLGALLRGMPMTSLVTTTAFFAPHSRDVHGFGVLFPRGSGVRALGVVFNTDAFDGRSAFRSETWIANLGESQSDDDIHDQLLSDREQLTRRRDTPIALVTTRWPRALPLYGRSILEAVSLRSELPPFLEVAGNYLGRIGLAGLVGIGREAADRLYGRLQPG